MCGLKGLLDLFERGMKQDILSRSSSQSDTVVNTWNTSFDRLPDLAKTLLQLLSYLHRDRIPIAIFKLAQIKLSTKTGVNHEFVPPPVVDFLRQFVCDTEWDALRFNEVLRNLSSTSLANYNSTTQMLSLHPLVQEWSRELDHNLGPAAWTIVALAIPSGRDIWDKSFQWLLLPHLRASEGYQMRLNAELLLAVGETYKDGGALIESRKIYEEVLSQSELGSEQHCVTAINLAEIFCELGHYEDAIRVHRTALDLARDLRPEHPCALEYMHHLAVILSRVGNQEEALIMRTNALELGKRITPGDHSKAFTSRKIIASILSQVNRHEEALSMQEQTLELCKRHLGSDHPQIVVHTGSLASILSDAGHHNKALKMHKQTLMLSKLSLGPGHQETLKTSNQIAAIHSHLGQHDEALKLYEKTLQLEKWVLGPGHPQTLTSNTNIAHVLRAIGRQEDSRENL
jgi:tetratricopeptide (TPR) repeat protein